MSAVEALAEVLRDGLFELDDKFSHEVMAECLGRWSVAAIRSMPAEQVAELIGGEVEVGRDGDSHYEQMFDPKRRVVTPWLPLGVSPETNGEQK